MLWQWKGGIFAAMLMGLLMAAPQPAQAATQEFTIIAIAYDNNSETADDMVMDYARKRAVFLAIQKLGVADPAAVAQHLPADAWTDIVRGATVTQHKREGNKTTAEVKVSILDAPLRAALHYKEAAAPVGQVEGGKPRSILVLPVYASPKKTFVWEKENALRDPLSSELLRQAHGTVMLPGGDLQDLRLIDDENVGKVKASELKPMFERYGADEIVMAVLMPGAMGTDEKDKIILRRLSQYDPQDELLEVQPDKDDTAAQRLNHDAQVIATACIQIANSTAGDDRAKLEKATKIPVKFVYTIPKELARMTDVVRHAPGVLSLDQPAIALNNVTGTIYLDGDKTELHKQLAAKGVIVRDQGDVWTLSIR